VTPLPAPLGGTEVVAWRLDEAIFAPTWNSGEGSYRYGGRWNTKGVRAVYCAIDPATAILEVAVHKGFETLDTVPHILTAVTITEPSQICVVDPKSLPNANWLGPGRPSAGQQEYGDALLAQHKFVIAPSVVSTRSWNLVFVGSVAAGAYTVRSQERFALDTRLHPPATR
jgi:RES domain-containing protein